MEIKNQRKGIFGVNLNHNMVKLNQMLGKKNQPKGKNEPKKEKI